MLRRTRSGLVVASLLAALFGPAAAGASKPTQPGPTRVDPAISSAFAYLRAHGVVPPWYDARPNPERPAGMIPIVVRSADPDGSAVTKRTLAALPPGEATVLHGGAPLASGAFSVLVTKTGFDRLAADRRISRLAIDLPRRRLRPLDASRTETHANDALRAMLTKSGTLLDGTGVTIADIDSGIYVHHPAFFRADAGALAWTDTDGNGTLTPGKDQVEIDGAAVVVQRLPAFGASFYPPYDEVLGLGTTLRPDVDFLYVDTNGNGERDYGKAFDESTPGYGEPLFVADDANGNGALDAGERLLRLGSSKLRAIYTDKNRTRGDAKSGIGDWEPSENYAEYTSHGTGVAGILVGGLWGQSKLLGLAPNADLLSYDYATKPPVSQTHAVQWALDENANVILTEYGLYTGQPLDGSSEEELLLDSAVAGGAVVVNPAGNLTTGGKHQSITVGATPTVVTLGTDAYFEGSQYVLLTVLEHGPEHTFTMSVTVPGQGQVSIADADGSPVDLGGGFAAQVMRERTAGGTTMRNVYVYGPDQMPMGAYALSLSLPGAAAPTPLELYVSDTTSSWSYGITFDDATDAKTVCHPATASRALSVAAYTLHDEKGYYNSSPVGSIAEYSSSGPLLNGDPGIALAAPDNPLSTGIPEYGKPGGEAASYAPFGGTSGAGPHVAATAALLRQAFPNETALQLRDRLTSTARSTGGPAERWGAGKLDAAAALGLAVGTSAAPRDARIQAPADGLVKGRDNKVQVAVTDDGTAFKTRWDLDYDGTPDTAWIDGLETTLTAADVGPRAIRVWVADADGNVTGATLATQVLAAPAQVTPDGGSEVQADDSGGADCECTSATRTPERMYGSAILTLLTAIGVLLPRFRRSRR